MSTHDRIVKKTTETHLPVVEKRIPRNEIGVMESTIAGKTNIGKETVTNTIVKEGEISRAKMMVEVVVIVVITRIGLVLLVESLTMVERNDTEIPREKGRKDITKAGEIKIVLKNAESPPTKKKMRLKSKAVNLPRWKKK